MKKQLITTIELLLVSAITFGQDSLSVDGYLSEMPSFMFQEWKGNWRVDNLIHNRLNLKWNNSSNDFSAVVEIRNRLMIGESVRDIPKYPQMANIDNGVVKLSVNIASGNSYVLNTRVDRAYIDYSKEKLQIRVGRQRINWGQCMVWNPNDLFNSSSFLDFDYIEKPGSDAVRIQYYPGSTSVFELAIKADHNNKITSAALFRFNKWNYDLQFLGGVVDGQDLILGAGWSGNILGASFRGEFSYFHPTQEFADTSGLFSISLGGDYTFRNSLVIQAEMLYQSSKKSLLTNFAGYYNMTLSPKKLSFTDFSLMIQGNYPITPLVNISAAIMYFPEIDGYYIGPSLAWSVMENMEFSVIIQSFTGKFTRERNDCLNMGFMRLKWNF